MADLSGIMGQLNALRGAYGGSQLTPNTVSNPAPLNIGTGTVFAPNPSTGRMANPGQYGGAFGSVAPLPPANSMGLPANWKSLTMPTTPATSGFFDWTSYTPVPRTLDGVEYGTMRPQGVAKLGLLPQGTNLSDTSIFGEMGPASGWGVRPGDVVRAWTALGQNPGQQMYDMAMQGGTFNPKGKFKSVASLPPDQMWNAAADDMVKMAMQAYLHDQGFSKHPVRNKNEPLKPK